MHYKVLLCLLDYKTQLPYYWVEVVRWDFWGTACVRTMSRNGKARHLVRDASSLLLRTVF